MPNVTQHQLEIAQATIGDIYAHLEQEVFEAFVKRLKARGIEDYTQTSVLQWQVQVMNDLHLVNNDVVAAVSKATGLAKPQLTDLFQNAGYSVASQEYDKLAKATGKAVSPNLTKQVLDGYLKQTFLDLDNNINQTLLTTNAAQNPAVQTFQQIAKETTADVITGLKTPNRALADTIYKWRDKGISRGLVDNGGHAWSLESYARTVITTTSNRAFQAVRDQAADDYGIDTFLMSSHSASREACAPIQGKTVTTRPAGFTAPESGEYFYPLDSFGYGEPGGTFGINCHHIKWPYIPGVNTNNQEQFDPEDAIAKGDVQQKQRALERRIRGYKSNLELAKKLEDDQGIEKYKSLVRNNQAAMRQLIKDHDFLARDYTREKAFGYTDKDVAAIRKRSTVNIEKQNRHIPGTEEFKEYEARRTAKGYHVQSQLSLTRAEIERIGDQYGVKDLSTRSLAVDTGQMVGYFVDQRTGKLVPTTRVMIKYSKTGYHMYPINPDRRD